MAKVAPRGNPNNDGAHGGYPYLAREENQVGERELARTAANKGRSSQSERQSIQLLIQAEVIAEAPGLVIFRTHMPES